MSPRVASIASCRSPSDSPPYARAPTLRPGNPVAPRVDGARLDPGRGARADLQRLERLPGTQDRAHGQLLHPDRRTLDHDGGADRERSEEHTSELQSPCNLVCRLLLEKKKKNEDKRKEPVTSLTSRE